MYGMYLKISTSSEKVIIDQIDPIIFSNNLENNEIIKNIQVLDKDKLLILIERDKKLIGLVYDIKNNQVIQSIER